MAPDRDPKETKIKATSAKKAAKVARSAKTGKFVTKTYAKKHPSTTVVETVNKPSKAKKPKGKRAKGKKR